jgi:hypothetical protein
VRKQDGFHPLGDDMRNIGSKTENLKLIRLDFAREELFFLFSIPTLDNKGSLRSRKHPSSFLSTAIAQEVSGKIKPRLNSKQAKTLCFTE